MSETITIQGFVASGVRKQDTQGGAELATFRMGATERRYNREEGTWEDGPTNWYSVSAFRSLAKHVAASLHKGEKVIVTGQLRQRNWTTADGRTGTSMDIAADTVGHDLRWGISGYRRITKDNPVPWVTAQAPDAGIEASPPGVNGETGEITEDQPGEEYGAGSAQDAADGLEESTTDDLGAVGEDVRAA